VVGGVVGELFIIPGARLVQLGSDIVRAERIKLGGDGRDAAERFNIFGAVALMGCGVNLLTRQSQFHVMGSLGSGGMSVKM
jgi:hypothetical protein